MATKEIWKIADISKIILSQLNGIFFNGYFWHYEGLISLMRWFTFKLKQFFNVPSVSNSLVSRSKKGCNLVPRAIPQFFFVVNSSEGSRLGKTLQMKLVKH